MRGMIAANGILAAGKEAVVDADGLVGGRGLHAEKVRAGRAEGLTEADDEAALAAHREDILGRRDRNVVGDAAAQPTVLDVAAETRRLIKSIDHICRWR